MTPLSAVDMLGVVILLLLTWLATFSSQQGLNALDVPNITDDGPYVTLDSRYMTDFDDGPTVAKDCRNVTVTRQRTTNSSSGNTSTICSTYCAQRGGVVIVCHKAHLIDMLNLASCVNLSVQRRIIGSGSSQCVCHCTLLGIQGTSPEFSAFTFLPASSILYLKSECAQQRRKRSIKQMIGLLKPMPNVLRQAFWHDVQEKPGKSDTELLIQHKGGVDYSSSHRQQRGTLGKHNQNQKDIDIQGVFENGREGSVAFSQQGGQMSVGKDRSSRDTDNIQEKIKIIQTQEKGDTEENIKITQTDPGDDPGDNIIIELKEGEMIDESEAQRETVIGDRWGRQTTLRITGIVLAVVAFCLLLACIITCCKKRRRANKNEKLSMANERRHSSLQEHMYRVRDSITKTWNYFRRRSTDVRRRLSDRFSASTDRAKSPKSSFAPGKNRNIPPQGTQIPQLSSPEDKYISRRAVEDDPAEPLEMETIPIKVQPDNLERLAYYCDDSVAEKQGGRHERAYRSTSEPQQKTARVQQKLVAGRSDQFRRKLTPPRNANVPGEHWPTARFVRKLSASEIPQFSAGDTYSSASARSSWVSKMNSSATPSKTSCSENTRSGQQRSAKKMKKRSDERYNRRAKSLRRHSDVIENPRWFFGAYSAPNVAVGPADQHFQKRSMSDRGIGFARHSLPQPSSDSLRYAASTNTPAKYSSQSSGEDKVKRKISKPESSNKLENIDFSRQEAVKSQSYIKQPDAVRRSVHQSSMPSSDPLGLKLVNEIVGDLSEQGWMREVRGLIGARPR